MEGSDNRVYFDIMKTLDFNKTSFSIYIFLQSTSYNPTQYISVYKLTPLHAPCLNTFPRLFTSYFVPSVVLLE